MRVIGGWRSEGRPERFSAWPLLIGAGLGSLQLYGFWRAEFGLTSLAVVLLCLIVLLFVLVQVVASVIVALIGGRWRKAASDFAGAAVGCFIISLTFIAPIERRFSLAAQSHYETLLVVAGTTERQTWLLDAQFLGPDETDLVYDESGSAAPPYGLRSYPADRDGCSFYTDRLGGHFYLESLRC